MPQFNQAQWNGGVTTTTGERLIYRALRDLKVLRAGQTASPESMQDGLEMLNDLLSMWSIERLAVFAIARELYELAAGEATLTIPRPIRIEAAGVVDAEGSERRISVLTDQDWQATRDKTASGTVTGVYWDRTLGGDVLNVTRVPAAGGEQLALYTWAPLGAFDTLESSYDFPAGYALALRFNLALALAPSFETHAKNQQAQLAVIADLARDTKARIKSINIPQMLLSVDAALLQRRSFNILTGRYD